MTGHYPWEDLIKTLPPETRARIKADNAKTLAEIRRQRELAKTEPAPSGPSRKPTGSRRGGPTR